MMRLGQTTVTLEDLAKRLDLPARHMIAEVLQFPEDRLARRLRLVISGVDMPVCRVGGVPEEIQLDTRT